VNLRQISNEELLARLYPPKDEADHLPDFARAAGPAPLDPSAPTDGRLPRMRDFFLPVDMGASRPAQLKQLYNEYIVEYLDAKGKQVRKWTENKNNHLFDLVKYAYAASSFLGLSSLHTAAAAKVAAAVAAAKQPELQLQQPHGGTSLYGQR